MVPAASFASHFVVKNGLRSASLSHAAEFLASKATSTQRRASRAAVPLYRRITPDYTLANDLDRVSKIYTSPVPRSDPAVRNQICIRQICDSHHRRPLNKLPLHVS